MAKKYFNKVTFWAREYKLPLFFQVIINRGKNTIALYKNSIIHAYYLDDAEEKLGVAGYRFFTDQKKVAAYRLQVREIRDGIKSLTAEFDKLRIRDITDRELDVKFNQAMSFLDKYVRVYLKTEAARLSRLDEVKYKKIIKQLGEDRFALRKEGESVFYILLGVILKEISRRFGVKVADLYFYDGDDMKRLFKGKMASGDLIKTRRRGYALICRGNKEVVLAGQEFDAVYKEVVLKKKNLDQLTGQTASCGRVRGRVRVIIHNKRNINNEVAAFKKGEILATEMTRPDTVLACRRAAAIVTDEGGITSHAAIISRELKIPCVIGTGNASLVLKNGDMIEVDADKGVVKILK